MMALDVKSDMQQWLADLRDLLDDKPVIVTRNHGMDLRVREDDVLIPGDMLIDALMDALIPHLVDESGLCDVDFDAEEDDPDDYYAPPPEVIHTPLEVTHTSDRDDDPAYRAARDSFNRFRAEERPAPVWDGSVAALPVVHRDEMDPDTRALHESVGETNEQYLGKQGGVYVVTLPPDDSGKLTHMRGENPFQHAVMQLLLTLTSFCPGALASEETWETIAEMGTVLQATFEAFPDDLRRMVAAGAFLISGAPAVPTVVGQPVDDETGGEMDALLLQFRLPDQLVMVVLRLA